MSGTPPARIAALLLGALLHGAPLCAQTVDALAGPGISLDLARHRAATISDLHYRLIFRLPADSRTPIRGELDLSLTRADAGPVILDFAAGQVLGVRVDGQPAAFRHERGHLVVTTTAARPGPVAIEVDFVAGNGPLNRRDDFLYTLFVPDRAHEAFPAFDQPDLKARYSLELVIPEDWRAVANGAEVAREPAGTGRVRLRFAPTEPIPTYLFAFAAGRFDVAEASRAGRTFRMLHRESDEAALARNIDAIFDLHATALAWLEEYTGIPYPFGKFDFVAIPSFQYGGMEHPGAILYRADALFLDETATRNEELGRASLIAHETAHMWFGDLVTMTWFDDVWMKEVFANFMAAKIVNPSFPDIDHELRFFLAHYPAAYGVDRTPGANPIRQTLANLDDAGSLYGAIIYQKAPIVMRQLELLTGEGAFREALRKYLRDHEFGNAGWPDLVAALDAVTPLDVAAWSRVWIEEPGRPTLAVEPDGRALRLAQVDPRGRGLVWPQALTLAFLAHPAGPADSVRAVRLPVRVDAAATMVDPHSAGPGSGPFVVPNAAGMGYGLFLLDDDTRDFLLTRLPSLPGALLRAVAWVDLWEMMLEGRVEPLRLMEAGHRALETETDELVAQRILGSLSTLYWRFLTPAARHRVSGHLEADLWRWLLAAEGTSRKAAFFNAWRSVATGPEAVTRMRDVWEGTRAIEGLPLSERDLTALALDLAVVDPAGADSVLARQRGRIENADRRARFDFIRSAASPHVSVRDSFFASLAEPANRSREEWVVAALSYLHHPLRTGSSLAYVRPSLELLEEIQATGDIFFPTRWLAATLGGHASADAAAVVRAFIEAHPDYPAPLMGKLLQEVDPVFRAARIRAVGGAR